MHNQTKAVRVKNQLILKTLNSALQSYDGQQKLLKSFSVFSQTNDKRKSLFCQTFFPAQPLLGWWAPDT